MGSPPHTRAHTHTHTGWLNGPEGAPYLIPWFILQKTFFFPLHLCSSSLSLLSLSSSLRLWGTPCQREALMVDDTLILWDWIYLLGDRHTHSCTSFEREVARTLKHIRHGETFICRHTYAHTHTHTLHTQSATVPARKATHTLLPVRRVPCGAQWYVLSLALPQPYRTHTDTHTHAQICIQFTCRLVVSPAQLLTVCQTQTCPWVKTIFHCHHYHHYHHHHPLHLSFSPSSLSLSLSLALFQALIFHSLSSLPSITTSPLSPPLPSPRRDVVSMFFLSRTLPRAASFFCTYPRKAGVHRVALSCPDLHYWTVLCV